MKPTIDDSLLRQRDEGAREKRGASVPTNGLRFWSLRVVLWFVALSAGAIYLANQWDEVPASKADHLLGTHPGKVKAVAYSPDGQWLASGGFEGPIVIWDMKRRPKEMVLPGGPDAVFTLAFSPDGSLLAAGGLDDRLGVWDTRSWTVTHNFESGSIRVRTLAFSPDGTLLAASGTEHCIRLWATDTWQIKRELKGNSSLVNRVAFSPDGRLVASSSVDGTARLWNLEEPVCKAVTLPRLPEAIGPLNCLAFSPDG
jgi:WD40 repeat protein